MAEPENDDDKDRADEIIGQASVEALGCGAMGCLSLPVLVVLISPVLFLMVNR